MVGPALMGKEGTTATKRKGCMQATIEDLSSVKKIIHIEVPQETVQLEIDSAYQSLNKTAKIKGFRPGKVPRSVLQRMFRKEVYDEVKAKLIQESLIEAIQANALNIVGEPALDVPELEEKAAYKFKSTVELKPTLPPIDYKGLSLKKKKYEVSEAELEGQVEMLRRNLAKYNEIKEVRPVQTGDIVLVDYEGFQDGKPFEFTPKAENYTLRIGAGRISDQFDAQIVGMGVGDEKQFEVTFPEEYPNKNFSNQTILYKVVVKSIREEELPELNDEFAKKFGPYENIDGLKQEIKNHLQKGYDKRIEQELNEQIFTQLIPKVDFEIPDVMVKFELEAIVDEAEKSFASNNMTLEQVGQTRESLGERYGWIAEKQVRRQLILNAIIMQENLTLSDDELETGFGDLARDYGQPVESLKAYYKEHPERIDFFKYTMLEKKAITLIMNSSTIEEVDPEPEKDGNSPQ